MSDIKSQPASKEYRNNWDEVFGGGAGKKKHAVWLILRRDSMCYIVQTKEQALRLRAEGEEIRKIEWEA